MTVNKSNWKIPTTLGGGQKTITSLGHCINLFFKMDRLFGKLTNTSYIVVWLTFSLKFNRLCMLVPIN